VAFTAVGVLATRSSGSGAFRGDILSSPVTLPSVTLTDNNDVPLSLPSLQPGHLLLVYFGYTHCPDVCPTTMADLAVALRNSSSAVRKETKVVFISSDPVRDTPAVINRWMSAFNFPTGDYVGLTGPLRTIDAAAKTVGVPLEPPVLEPDGTYAVQHGAQILAFEGGSATHLWLAGTSPADYTHDIAMLSKSVAA
jgi:protein SCO1/2